MRSSNLTVEQRFTGVLAAILGSAALLATILLFKLLGPDVAAVVIGVLRIVALPLAMLLCLWNGSSLEWLPPQSPASVKSQAYVPLVLALASAGTLTGGLVNAYFIIFAHQPVPLPFLDDACYLTGFALFLVAFWLLPGRALDRSASVRAVLDGLLVVGAVLTVAWPAAIGPILLDPGASLQIRLVTAAYPLLSGLGLSCLLLLWIQADGRVPLRTLLLATGAFLALSVSATTMVADMFNGLYHLDEVANVGWPLATLLIGLGSATFRRWLRDQHPDRRTTSRRVANAFVLPRLWQLVLPYGLLPIVAWSAYGVLKNPAAVYLIPGLVIGDGLLISCLILRQILALVDNQRLDADLLAAQRRSEAWWRALAENASDIVEVIDAQGIVTYVSPSIARVLGYQPDELVGRPSLGVDQTHPDDREYLRREATAVRAESHGRAQLEFRIQHADGSWRTLDAVLTNLLAEPDIRGIVVNARDVTERKAVEDQLQHQAFHDPLTGLPNRALFLDRLAHTLARASRHAGIVGVLFLDLDHFKVVNDSLGHAAGDLLLQAVAARLALHVRDGDTVARFGGDEFAILLDELADATAATHAADRITQAFDQPFQLGGHDVVTSISTGVVTNASRQIADELLREADLALYRAKAGGRARFEIFDPSMNAQALERLELEADLRRGLERGEFVAYYQPKIELGTSRFVGLEALARWHHPRRGLVAPATFIGLAEETGLIRPLGQWVLEEACRQTRRWRELAPELAIVTSVNLSARQFSHPTLVADVARALDESGVEPSAIQLEITESVAMGDAESTINTLSQLKALGVQLAIDDFGTGYSSLAYLKRFPVDTLKIDRAFITDLDPHTDDASIVKAIVNLGQALRLTVVAEGVENARQSAHLIDLGCHVGQGYYFARPLPREDAEAFLRASRRPTLVAA